MTDATEIALNDNATNSTGREMFNSFYASEILTNETEENRPVFDTIRNSIATTTIEIIYSSTSVPIITTIDATSSSTSVPITTTIDATSSSTSVPITTTIDATSSSTSVPITTTINPIFDSTTELSTTTVTYGHRERMLVPSVGAKLSDLFVDLELSTK